jgi:hypothetical protein
MIAAADRPHDLARLRRGFAHVFLGDWHPMLRDPLDLFRLSLVLGAAAFAIAGDASAAVRLALPGLLVLAVRALDVPRAIDWIFVLAMAFQGWGNALELFTYLALSRLDVVPDPCDRAGARAELFGMVFVTLCIGVSAASFYEIYEWVVVNWLGENLFTSESDTINDLFDGFIGAGIGGALLATWALSRYHTRCIPRSIGDAS